MSDPAPEQSEQEEQTAPRFFDVVMPDVNGLIRDACNRGEHSLESNWVHGISFAKGRRVQDMVLVRRCTWCKKSEKEIKKQHRQLFWKKVRNFFTRFFKRTSR